MQALPGENNKTFFKDNEDDFYKWGVMPYLYIIRLKTEKICQFSSNSPPELTSIFNSIPLKV